MNMLRAPTRSFRYPIIVSLFETSIPVCGKLVDISQDYQYMKNGTPDISHDWLGTTGQFILIMHLHRKVTKRDLSNRQLIHNSISFVAECLEDAWLNYCPRGYNSLCEGPQTFCCFRRLPTRTRSHQLNMATLSNTISFRARGYLSTGETCPALHRTWNRKRRRRTRF